MKNIYLLSRTDQYRGLWCTGELETAVVVVSDHDELEAIINGLFTDKRDCDFTFQELTGEIIDFTKEPRYTNHEGQELSRSDIFARHIGTTDASKYSGVINRSYIR